MEGGRLRAGRTGLEPAESFIRLLEVSRDKDVRLDSSAGTRDESKVPPEEKRKSGSFIYLLFFLQ